MATVVLVGTLDSKGTEYQYVKDCILRTGAEVLVIDCSLLSKPYFTPEISAEEVAQAAGVTLGEIQFESEGNGARDRAVATMSNGVAALLKKLHTEGKLHAVMGLGGGGGTNMLAPAMRALPIGVPKMIVSTIMAGNIRSLVAGSDITMMNAVTDISGVNRISKKILANASFAAAGMAMQFEKNKESPSDKPLVAITMYGVTTKGVLQVREKLEQKGFEVVCFHSNGTGGFTMEKMVEDGIIDGVIDYTTAELTAHYAHGKGDGGDDRLLRNAKSGIPWVAVPGALELSNYYCPEDIPPKFRGKERRMLSHNANTFQVRMLSEDFKVIGKLWAERVSMSKGPVTVLFPKLGLEACNEPGGVWYAPEEDAVLFDTIRQNMRKDIPILEYDLHINSERFAELTVEAFMRNWDKLHNKKL